MKKQLLRWYCKQKIGGRTFWRKELEGARMEEEEPLDLYGVRLMSMAELAYSDSKTECGRQVRKKFLESIDKSIADKLLDTERILKASSSRKKHLSFDRLCDIARDLQREQERSRTVMWSSHVPRVVAGSEAEGSRASRKSKTFRRTSSTSQAAGESNRRTICHFCKRPGHIRRECWRASKLCLICGENHHIEKCPRYKPNYRSAAHDQMKKLPLEQTELN